MRKLTAVLAALGTIGTAGIAAVLFCVGVYAEGSRGGTWRIWTAADDREAGGGWSSDVVSCDPAGCEHQRRSVAGHAGDRGMDHPVSGRYVKGKNKWMQKSNQGKCRTGADGS